MHLFPLSYALIRTKKSQILVWIYPKIRYGHDNFFTLAYSAIVYFQARHLPVKSTGFGTREFTQLGLVFPFMRPGTL